MVKKIFIVATAALLLAGAGSVTRSSAEAGGFGRVIAAGVVGAVIDSAPPARPAFHPSYGGGYDGVYRPAFRPVAYGCGFAAHPVFDGYGNQIGVQRVPAC